MEMEAVKFTRVKRDKNTSCHYCGNYITGRADKRFCDDSCRSAYNNGLKSAANNYIRNVNNALGKNRRILEGLLIGETSVKVTGDKLLRQGFNFKYHTHTFTASTGKTYFYCYDYGYLKTDESYLIVRGRD